MTLEFGHIVIIILLLLILIGVVSVAVVEAQIKDKLNSAPSNGRNGSTDWKLLAEQVAALFRESIPAEGATLSRRVNDIAKDIVKLLDGEIKRASSVEEQRNAFRITQDTAARAAGEQATLREKMEAQALAQASQAKATDKVVNLINSVGTAGQTIAGHDQNVVDVSGQAGQIGAGSGIDQAQGGVGVTKEGVDTIQKGLDTMKGETK